MTPANWIKKLRLTKEIKQTTMANRLGITQQAYSKMENGIWVSKQRLPKVLEAMESTLDELKYIGNMIRLRESSMHVAEDDVKYIMREPKQQMRA